MSDTLEAFILEGPEREVDAWWAEEGMGLSVCRCGSDPECECETDAVIDWKGNIVCPYDQMNFNYTTDRGLRYVIEDRVRGDRWFYYCQELIDIVDRIGGTESYLVGKALDATNRQVILAAARAMGLTYGEQSGQ